jgi:hypothetical protein
MSYYISPRFLDKLSIHITKNYLDIPSVKVPLILGITDVRVRANLFSAN